MPNWLYEAMAVGIVNGGAMAAITIPLYFFQRYLSKRSAGKKADGDPRLEKLYLQLDEQHNRKTSNSAAIFGTITVSATVSYLAYFLAQLEVFIFGFVVLVPFTISIIGRLNEKRSDIHKKIESIRSEIKMIETERRNLPTSTEQTILSATKPPLATDIASKNPSIFTKKSIDHDKEASEVSFEQSQSTESFSHPLEEAFSILLEHDDDVRNMYEGVSGLPNPVKQSILREVLKNPKEEIMKIRNAVILASLKRPDLEWNNDLDNLVVKCKTADPENVNEFFKVFPILSHRMSIHEIRLKVFQLSQKTFYVETIAGRDVLVTQIGDDIFKFTSLISGSVTLSSLDEVYNYLGTPENRRYRKKSL